MHSQLRQSKWRSGSLYWKIAGVFLLIAALTTVVCSVVFYRMWNRYSRTADQWVNWELAENLARELQPYIEKDLDVPKVEAVVHRLAEYNPEVELYLTDASGAILFSPVEFHDSKVDTKVIETFLNSSGAPLDPIRGLDPRRPATYPQIFSAARAVINGSPGYVYVILNGHRKRDVYQYQGDAVAWQASGSFFGTVFAISVCIGVLFFYALTRRFARMTEVLRDFEAGDYSKRIESTSNDELGIHARAFNRMADTISANIEQLKKADSLRRELVANISHDLRLPLAVIQAHLDTLSIKLNDADLEQRQKLLKEAIESCEFLNELLGDLFELSKLSADDYKPNREEFALDELALDLLIKLKPMALERGVELHDDIPQKLPFVSADLKMINRAISNLIENAIRYTPAGGRVDVSVQQKDDKILVTVADTGIGVAPEELEHIFDRFFRGSTGKRKEHEGTGLGLAIVKKTFEVHGEQIRVASELGKGTRFEFELPLVS